MIFKEICKCVGGYCDSSGYCDLCDLKDCSYKLFGIDLGLAFLIISGIVIFLIVISAFHKHKWRINRGLETRTCIKCGKKELFNSFNFNKIRDLKTK